MAKWVAGSYLDSCQTVVGLGPSVQGFSEAFTLFPNPVGEQLHVSLGGRGLCNETVDVVDAQGKLVLRARTDADGTLWLPSLGTGLYSVLWLGPDGSTPSSVRFIKH
ncbi:MAG: T9SS type A sorting domain-containing protein [Flavobacteriales bacterium]|nr:T9SS type A sorting domain-containing protein [Flavobacteriales bacterium]